MPSRRYIYIYVYVFLYLSICSSPFLFHFVPLSFIQALWRWWWLTSNYQNRLEGAVFLPPCRRFSHVFFFFFYVIIVFSIFFLLLSSLCFLDALQRAALADVTPPRDVTSQRLLSESCARLIVCLDHRVFPTSRHGFRDLLAAFAIARAERM